MPQADAQVLNAPDGKGYTPLHVACAGGYADCVVALCQAGCRTEIKNDVGLTAWDLATQLHRTEVIGLNLTDLENTAQRYRAKRVGKKKRARASKMASTSGPSLVPIPSLASQVDAQSTETEKSKTVVL